MCVEWVAPGEDPEDSTLNDDEIPESSVRCLKIETEQVRKMYKIHGDLSG